MAKPDAPRRDRPAEQTYSKTCTAAFPQGAMAKAEGDFLGRFLFCAFGVRAIAMLPALGEVLGGIVRSLLAPFQALSRTVCALLTVGEVIAAALL